MAQNSDSSIAHIRVLYKTWIRIIICKDIFYDAEPTAKSSTLTLNQHLKKVSKSFKEMDSNW